MADVTGSVHRALLTLDQRFVSSALSASGVNGADFSQAGPMPGRPVASSGAPAMQASGTQGTRTVETYTVRGGNPGAAVNLITGEYPAGPGIAWRYSGDVLYRGWDAPDTIAEFEYLDRSTTAAQWLDCHAVTRADGRAFLVVQEAQRYVSVWTRPIGGAWAATAARPYDAFSAVYVAPIAAAPCLVNLPGKRLLCLWYRYHATAPGIVSSISADDGATWSTPQSVEGIVGVSLPLRPIRIRAAYSGGQVVMFVYTQGGVDSLTQFASIDDGASFAPVTTAIGGDNACGYPEVVAVTGGFVLATIESNRATTGLPSPPRTAIAYSRRFASAFTLALGVTPVCIQTQGTTREWGTVAAGLLTAGEMAMTVDDAGWIWIIGINFATAGNRSGATFASDDGGLTWAAGVGSWWLGLDASTHPRRISVCAQGGRLIVPHQHAAAPAIADDSLGVLYLGGPTTVPQPQATVSVSLPSLAKPYTVTWAPYDLPEDTGATWVYTSTGAPTISLTGQGVRIQHAGVGDSATWTALPTTTNAQGLLLTMDLRTAVGNSYVSARVGEAGPTSYEARVQVFSGSIVLRDVTGAVDIATITTTAGTTGVQVKLVVGSTTAGAASGKCQAWYRAWGGNADREWILIGASTALVRGAATTPQIQWGTVSGLATTDAYCRLAQYAQGTACGVGLYDQANTVNPRDLLGQPIGPAPYPLAESGLRVAMQAGPLKIGDTHTVAPLFAYPIASIDPVASASPAARWRSLVDNVSQRIVWTMAEATPIESPLVGLYLDGANFSTATLDGWNGAAWVTLGTIDLRIGTVLRFTRAGEIVRCDPTGGSSIADYIDKGALRDCTWSTGAGGVRRRIRTNTGGRWSASGVINTTRPTIVLDSFVVGDPAAGATAEVWSPRAAMILRGRLTAYSRYSLHIPAQLTVEGYYELGVAMIGPCTVIGAPDTSRQLAAETNVETVRARNGSRKKRRLGVAPRTAQLAWSDGLDTSNLHDASPDYVTDYTGGNSVSTPAGIAGDVHALVIENDTTPVVYLPVVPVAANAAVVTCITARSLMLYADIASDVIQSDVAAGDEHVGAGAGEYVRVSTVRLEEVQ